MRDLYWIMNEFKRVLNLKLT